MYDLGQTPGRGQSELWQATSASGVFDFYLEATLLFLSTGASYSSFQYPTRISKQSLSQIVPDTCQAIYDELKDEYLQWERAHRWFAVVSSSMTSFTLVIAAHTTENW
ncbi:hypothetical protein E2C01_076254 [Portunus trituberculatus]|uniref:Uncharacterized protein n=1 Tax=Portunus trituberculatus TaxID=210409 RepID=A0A5B7II36_PORTR|nr:hypothetical protein [Portunus trituberculatus]